MPNLYKKIVAVIMAIGLVISLSGCSNLKLIEKAPEDEKTEEVKQEQPKINQVDDGDNYVVDGDTNKTDTEVESENNEPTAISENEKTVNGVKFKLKERTAYLSETTPVYTNPNKQQTATTFNRGMELKVTGVSIDGKLTMFKSSTGRTYFVESSKVVDVQPEPEPEPVPTPTPNQSNDNNNNNNNNNSNNSNNSNNNSNNNNNYSGNNNNNNNNNNNYQSACYGVCWPGGYPERYINGVGFVSANFTAWITQTTYIYTAPSYSASSEWLAEGTELNCTGICENNFVQVLLANGAYVYIDGNYLRR